MKTDDKEVVLTLSLPGYRQDEVSVRVLAHAIMVHAKRHREMGPLTGGVSEQRMKEYTYEAITPLLDKKRAKISFKKGVLRVIAPRKRV